MALPAQSFDLEETYLFAFLHYGLWIVRSSNENVQVDNRNLHCLSICTKVSLFIMCHIFIDIGRMFGSGLVSIVSDDSDQDH
jgi:hypothetical protein